MNQRFSLRRRAFIKTFTFATAYSTLLRTVRTDIVAAEIIPLATSSTGTLRLKLSNFPALANEFGSVRLIINPLIGGPPNGPRPDGQFYPVIINRAANNTFYALNSRCTHQNCVVDPLDPSINQMICPCHGSVFAIDGRRVSGQATSALTRYMVRFDGTNTLEVQIPSLGYTVVGSLIQGAGNARGRVRLEFRALRKIEYEVHFRDSLDKEAAPVPFSSTPDGPLEQTVFSVNTNTNASLYVERNAAAGFYTIAVRIVEA